jgi:hypothetical protein
MPSSDRTAELTDAERAWMLSGERSPDLGPETFRPGALERLWETWRDDLLAAWVAAHPGSRPHAWWQVDAPGPRERRGGTGTPAHEVLAYAPVYDCGIPAYWVTTWDATYYRGEAVDVAGNPIGLEYRGRDFRGVPIDPEDPPRFESEAAYLARHELLTDAERARLTSADFEPEVRPSGSPPWASK